MSEIKKRVPQFIQVADVKPGQKGFNVYAKVTSSQIETFEKKNGEKLVVANVTVGDESASVNARFTGANAQLLQVGVVFALRNGRSEVNNERQRLEIDKFGKLTVEDSSKVKSVNSEKNLSNTLYEIKQVQNDKKKKR